MAITVITEAEKVAFAKNKAIFKVSTDSYKDSDGQVAVHKLLINSIPDTGDTIPIIWDGGNVAIEAEFVSVLDSVADSTGLKIRDDADTKLNVATVIKLKLESNSLIDEAYTLTTEVDGSDYYVVFTANEVGTKYNLTLGLEDAWCTWSKTTTGGDEVYDGEYYLITKIYTAADVNGPFTFLADIPSKPLKDQTVQVDVAEILRSVVQGYHLPAIGQSTEIKNTSLHKAYKLVFVDKKPGQLGSYQPGPQVVGKVIVAGGLSKGHFAQYPNAYTNWFADGKRWMTWFPNNQEVMDDQEHFLSFLNYDETNDTGAGS